METSNNRFDVVWRQLSQFATFRDYVTAEDRKVYARRARNEGDEFRTVGLASLGASLLTSLAKGRFEVEEPGRWHPKKGSVLPAFLYKAWVLIFTDDGRLRYDAGVWAAVDCIRQLTTVFAKLPLPHKPSVCEGVLERFISNETTLHYAAKDGFSCPSFDGRTYESWSDAPLGVYKDMFVFTDSVRNLISRVLCSADPRDIKPRHGSGASACGTRPWERYKTFRFCPKIDKIWPYSEYFFASPNHLVDEMSKLHDAEDLPRQAKAVFVPKDYRGPRLISCEPRELMYVQQGLMTLMYDTLEHGILTKGEVNFTDQFVNQRLARAGSYSSIHSLTARMMNHLARDGSADTITSLGTEEWPGENWVTLDLKDASDLVSWKWVQRTFPPNWVEALDACRSVATKLPDGRIIELDKHAPMGSGVCFPVLSLFVWAVIKTACNTSVPPRGRSGATKWRRSSEAVYVYGDDVIVRKEVADTAILALQRVGLVVNAKKSFTGYHGFRESCGGEYYGGHDVTPVKLKSLVTDSNADLVSLVAFVNNLSNKYGVYGALPLIDTVHRNTRVPVLGTLLQDVYDPDDDIRLRINGIQKEDVHTKPFGLIGPGVMKHASLNALRRRWNKDLQRFEFRVMCVKPVFTKVDPDDWSYVQRYLLIGGDDLGMRGRHALSRRVRYKLEWAHIA